THYSSLYNDQVNRLTKKLGFAQTWMWCAYYGSTPVTDALFGVKYVISGDDMPPGYEPVAQAGGLTLWKSPKTLPLAFMAAGEVPELADNNCFVRQNTLISGLTQANTSVFIPVETVAEPESLGGTRLTFTGTGKPIYADLSANGLREVLVNGEHLLWLGSSEWASVHYLGTPAEGEAWTVTVRHFGNWAGRLWELDQSALYAVMERLDNTEILSVEKDGRVRLAVRSGTEGELATTIPAEKGWTAYVDGKKVDTGVWLETFLTVPLYAGEHEIELRYTAPGLVHGMALGALSLAGLALAVLEKRRNA
ncbi:MAG: YfhO family protein, partial [Oscillospiraceae bacterium]|nr:YfhO family protein [Oscillospiraceae bacterium]